MVNSIGFFWRTNLSKGLQEGMFVANLKTIDQRLRPKERRVTRVGARFIFPGQGGTKVVNWIAQFSYGVWQTHSICRPKSHLKTSCSRWSSGKQIYNSYLQTSPWVDVMTAEIPTSPDLFLKKGCLKYAWWHKSWRECDTFLCDTTVTSLCAGATTCHLQ